MSIHRGPAAPRSNRRREERAASIEAAHHTGRLLAWQFVVSHHRAGAVWLVAGEASTRAHRLRRSMAAFRRSMWAAVGGNPGPPRSTATGRLHRKKALL